jgi:hypothetical protein
MAFANAKYNRMAFGNQGRTHRADANHVRSRSSATASLRIPALRLRGLYLQAAIAAGLDHPLLLQYGGNVAETVRTVLPTLESLDIASANEVNVDTLAARLRDEAVATRATVV